jgi:hypothetical integral membrane protein (TIGR02206 family)
MGLTGTALPENGAGSTARWAMEDAAMDAFVPYGGLHAVALAVCAVAIAAPTIVGRRLEAKSETILRGGLAALAFTYWLAYNVWWNWHGLDPRSGLPLQLCDINGLLAPFALLSGWRAARATVYFWTAALTIQAFIQPSLTAGPASPVFWAFWTAHSLIAACAVYDIVALRYRPRWSDLGLALLGSAAYVAVVVPVNYWFGSNYGFLGDPASVTDVPPFIDALGPWPQRAIILIVLVPLGFVIVLLPWLIFSPRRERRQPVTSNTEQIAPSI